jgi:predicted nucleic acid-binding protein
VTRLYLDTSALLPLLLPDEPAAAGMASWWNQANEGATVRLTYVEARAGLARAQREGRLRPAELRDAVERLHELWAQLAVVEVDADLATTAGDLAERLALRGYDAVQLAAATTLNGPDLIFLTGDHRLLDAALTLMHAASTT